MAMMRAKSLVGGGEGCVSWTKKRRDGRQEKDVECRPSAERVHGSCERRDSDKIHSENCLPSSQLLNLVTPVFDVNIFSDENVRTL